MPQKLPKRAEVLLKKINNPAQLIATLNPDFCSQRYSDFNTEIAALQSGLIKLSEINLAFERGTAEDLLSAWLLNLSLYTRIEVDKKLIQEISRELYKDIFMLNIAELTLFFSKLKRGIYGTLYGRFDGMMICSAAREYRMSRGRVFASLPSDEQKKLTM